MKLKLKFWKTKKAVAVTILEQKGLPTFKDNDNDIIIIRDISNISARTDKLIIGSYFNKIKGRMDYVDVDNVRKYIDMIIKAVTEELFVPEQQKVKVGDIVILNDNNIICYKVLDILPEEYHNRYIIATDCNAIGKPVVYAHQTVTPVNKRFTFTKEITEDLETYTWEI